MTRWPYVLFYLSLVVLSAGHASATAPVTVRLSSPTTNAGVPFRPCISGTVSDPNLPVFVVVHPLAIGSFYVQPQPTVRRDDAAAGFFTLQATIAEQSSRFEGQHFEIMAVAGPRVRLREGQILAGWPKGAAHSNVIEVIRRDAAPDGCGDALDPPATATGHISDGGARGSLETTTAASSDTGEPAAAVLVLGGISGANMLWTMLAALTVTFVLCPGRVLSMCSRLERTIARVWSALVAIFWWGIANVGRWSAASLAPFSAGAGWTWRTHAHAFSLRALVIRVLAVLILVPTSWLAFIIDSHAILPGLSLIFPVAPRSGNAGDLFGLAGPVIDAAKVLVQGPSQLTWATDPVVTLWMDGELGAMSVGLAALQAGFGMVLLVGMTQERSIGATVVALYRARPLLTTCFAVFNLALAGLAGYRGYELSPEGSSGYLPALLAAALAAVMPWVMAFALHVVVDSVANAAAAIGVVVALVVSCLGCAVAPVAGVAALAGLVVAAVVVLGLAIVCCALTTACLHFTVIFGEAVLAAVRFVRWLFRLQPLVRVYAK